MIRGGTIIASAVYREVDFSELTDVHGDRVYGMPTAGIGRLLVWGLNPSEDWPSLCLWIAVVPLEGETITETLEGEHAFEAIHKAVHDWPPKELLD